MRCEINCDMGEGMANEEALIPFITAANVACGFHAGDERTMRHVVRLCRDAGVAIGAHPSYPDRANFGRRDLIGTGMTPADIHGIVTEQIELALAACRAEGAVLRHIKLHGALYNRAAWDAEVASQVCRAVRDADPALVVYGLSGSRFHAVAAEYGLTSMHEVFADRTYQDDGSLTPRTSPGALIETDEGALHQVTQMVQDGSVTTITGRRLAIIAQTICLHGDGLHALPFARLLHSFLKEPSPTGSHEPNHL
jgi:UPF0271 protein